MKTKIFTALCAVVGLFSAAVSAETLSGKKYPLPVDWLLKTYSDKTWEWDDGHGYFAPDGTFQAAVGGTQSANGRWYAAKGGKICFQAEWVAETGSGPAKKCWKHVADEDDRMWQAALEGGFRRNWIRFDPETQLKPGNLYESRFEYASGARKGFRAKPMDPMDVAKIYAGNTWEWEDGHAYFGSGGVVTAVSGKDSIGEGSWYATGPGHLCINAVWTGPAYGSVQKERCWLHAEDEEGVIWQAPTDDMRKWSRFTPAEDLVAGNPHASRFARQKGGLR